MKLKEFIKAHYAGVIRKFAQANNRAPQQFAVNLNKGNFYVIRIDGQLKLVQEKMAINEPAGDSKNENI